MSPDLPLLDRLAQLPPVPVSELIALLERMERPQQDALLAPLLRVDEEEGQRAVHPLLPAVIQHLQQKPGLACYQALSPTLGFASENPEWSRAWLADPTTHDAGLVQQCMVRLLLSVRGMAEARAAELDESAAH